MMGIRDRVLHLFSVVLSNSSIIVINLEDLDRFFIIPGGSKPFIISSSESGGNQDISDILLNSTLHSLLYFL